MQRDSHFDNYKGLLITLVLIGHFIIPLIEKNHLADFLVKTIYSFHMPAFVFISAYFSKQNSLLKLIKNLLLPYIIFQIIYYLFSNYIWDKEKAFEIFQPDFSLWFLLSLFCWRSLINHVIKIKGILFLSFLIGIISGFDNSIGAFASLGRTITFFPYFILGYQFDKKKFMKYAAGKSIKILSVLLISAAFLFLFTEYDKINFDLLTLKYSYQKIDLPKWGWLYRTALYIFSSILIYLIFIIIPRQRYWFTYLGQRTLSIYLLHGIIYRTVQYMTPAYKRIDTNKEVIYTVLFAVLLSFLISLKPFDFCIKKICSLPLESILKKDHNISPHNH